MRALAATLAGLLVGCPSVPQSPKGGCNEGLLLGVCVSDEAADAFCGHAATPVSGGGCARHTCKPGEALELDSGVCLPASVTHGLLTHDPEDTRIAFCEGGVVERSSPTSDLTCASGASACRRGEHFVDAKGKKGCEALPPCGLGELFDEGVSRCVRVKKRVVDVGTWARLVLGPDGGEGTSAFCAPIRAASPQTSRFRLSLTFGNNDVTQLGAHLEALPPTTAAASDAAEKSLNGLTELLRFMGGETSAASVSLELVCTVPQVFPPILKPR